MTFVHPPAPGSTGDHPPPVEPEEGGGLPSCPRVVRVPFLPQPPVHELFEFRSSHNKFPEETFLSDSTLHREIVVALAHRTGRRCDVVVVVIVESGRGGLGLCEDRCVQRGLYGRENGGTDHRGRRPLAWEVGCFGWGLEGAGRVCWWMLARSRSGMMLPSRSSNLITNLSDRTLCRRRPPSHEAVHDIHESTQLTLHESTTSMNPPFDQHIAPPYRFSSS